MKSVIIFGALVMCVLAAPLDDSKNAQVLEYNNDNIGIDGYKFNYATSDGINRQEQGQLEDVGTDHAAIAVRGTISWTAPDGQQFTMNYVADKNGYQPEGAHLVKA